MQYFKPYTYFVSKANGGMNLLWGSLAFFSTSFIPVLGQLVMIGYQAEVADDLKSDPDIERYPDFDINRFVQYLTRSIWPFVAQLIVGVAVLFVLAIAAGVGVAVGVATDEVVIGVLAGLVVYLPLVVCAAMLSWPLVLHAQLSQSFQLGESIRFTRSFVRMVGGQLFMSLLVHMLLSIPLTIVGLLLCFIGLYPAMMIQFMAQEHYMIQLYRLYLDEGGEPIRGPSKEREFDA